MPSAHDGNIAEPSLRPHRRALTYRLTDGKSCPRREVFSLKSDSFPTTVRIGALNGSVFNTFRRTRRNPRTWSQIARYPRGALKPLKPQSIDAISSAVAHPIRLQLLTLLTTGERSVGDLASQFPVSRAAISQHLRILEMSGLAVSRRAGKRVLYEWHRPTVQAFTAWLDEMESHSRRSQRPRPSSKRSRPKRIGREPRLVDGYLERVGDGYVSSPSTSNQFLSRGESGGLDRRSHYGGWSKKRSISAHG